MQIRNLTVAAFSLAALACHGRAQAASTDPVIAGAHPRDAHSHTPQPAHRSGSLGFTVSVKGGVFDFPATLAQGKNGRLTGTVTAPSGCVGTVQTRSTDQYKQLTMGVSFGGNCNGEPGSFVGTLKFKKAHGSGTFTDPYASGPYTVH